MKKRILFICKHNLFRSQVARILFNKINKNKDYFSDSAGIIKWNKKDLIGDKNYQIEKEISKNFGIKLNKYNSKNLSSLLLKKTDILVIVADDVPPILFKNEKSFNGKVIVWKTKDIKPSYKNKEKVAESTIKFIEKNIKKLTKRLDY
jgi:protein-tyrosine-phosphatase